ncbi:MAG TPA: hypothetical protein VEA19_02955, partial [Actinomycetota bacterium]|nr:hypothetical protein [Actinomycetota bacterium]
ASEAVFQAAFLAGVSLSGWFGSHFGIRQTFGLSGGLLLLTAVMCWLLLGSSPGKHRQPKSVRTVRVQTPAVVGRQR